MYVRISTIRGKGRRYCRLQLTSNHVGVAVHTVYAYPVFGQTLCAVHMCTCTCGCAASLSVRDHSQADRFIGVYSHSTLSLRVKTGSWSTGIHVMKAP